MNTEFLSCPCFSMSLCVFSSKFTLSLGLTSVRAKALPEFMKAPFGAVAFSPEGFHILSEGFSPMRRVTYKLFTQNVIASRD